MAAGVMLLAEVAEKKFTVEGPLVAGSFEIAGITIKISETVIIQFGVAIVLSILFFFLGRNLSVRPKSRRQVVAEFIATFFSDYVKTSMGSDKYRFLMPYIGALFCISMCSSLTGFFGFRTPTSDLSVIIAWGLITFALVQINKIRTGGIKGMGKSFLEPSPIMLPFNILGEFTNPMSLTLRHFANITAGGVVGGLIYFALGNFAVILPAATSLYFDLFSAVIQAYIFITLTMAYIYMAECD